MSAASLPRISVARWEALGRCSTDGSAGASSDEQNGARDFRQRADPVLVLAAVLRRGQQLSGQPGVVGGTWRGRTVHATGIQALPGAAPFCPAGAASYSATTSSLYCAGERPQ